MQGTGFHTSASPRIIDSIVFVHLACLPARVLITTSTFPRTDSATGGPAMGTLWFAIIFQAAVIVHLT